MKPQWIHENVHTGIGEHKNPTGGATNKTIMIHVKHCASNFDIVEIRFSLNGVILMISPMQL